MELGKYKHYKGNYYEVLGLCMDTETKEKKVLYKALYDCPSMEKEYGTLRPKFIRSYDMFNEYIEKDGKSVKRFQKVEE